MACKCTIFAWHVGTHNVEPALSLSLSLSLLCARTSARACGVQQYSTVKMWAHSLTAITTHKRECEHKRESEGKRETVIDYIHKGCNQKQKTKNKKQKTYEHMHAYNAYLFHFYSVQNGMRSMQHAARSRRETCFLMASLSASPSSLTLLAACSPFCEAASLLLAILLLRLVFS